MKFKSIYTKSGDNGMTKSSTGEDVSKGLIQIECVGKMDTFSSVLGLCKLYCDDTIEHVLTTLQHNLVKIMGQTSAWNYEEYRKKYGIDSVLGSTDIMAIDSWYTEYAEKLDSKKIEQKDWVMYGSDFGSAYLDHASCVCRETEVNFIRTKHLSSLVSGRNQGLDKTDIPRWFNVTGKLLYILARCHQHGILNTRFKIDVNYI